MPKILDTPETLIEQQALTVNRKDITRYTVDVPLDGDPSLSVTYLAREMDPVSGLPLNGAIVQAPTLSGEAVTTAMGIAGVKVILAALQLLPLSEEIKVTVASVTSANAAMAGEAYYSGTRDALYEGI